MDWLRYIAIASLMVAATLAGGTIVRIVVAARDLRVTATLVLVALLVVVAVASGARGRRWRKNPYW